jgi:fructokinase
MIEQALTAKVISFGEILWDILPGGTVLGGAPFNLAFRVSSLGDRGLIVSRLGRDELGRKAREAVAALGLDPSLLQWDERFPTGTVEVSFGPDRSPDYRIIRDAAYDYIERTDALEEAVMNADCFCFGTLAQRSDTARRSLEALLEASDKSLKVLDINLRRECYTPSVVKDSLKRADILKLNEEEARVLGPLLFGRELSVPDFCTAVLDKQLLKCLLVTLGERGAFACSGEGELVYAPGYRVKVADTVGAGDAFTAGFIHALFRRRALAEACDSGNVLGALCSTRKGATVPIPETEISEFRQNPPERIVDPDYDRYSRLA